MRFSNKYELNTKILKVAIPDVIPEKTAGFEDHFEVAQEIISSMNGWLGHQLQQCLEVPNRYILLVRWVKLEDHTIGSRQSPTYQKWKKLLHDFYAPFAVVEHSTTKYEK